MLNSLVLSALFVGISWWVGPLSALLLRFYVRNESDFFVVNDDAPVKWCFSQVKGTVEEDITEGRLFYQSVLLSFARYDYPQRENSLQP